MNRRLTPIGLLLSLVLMQTIASASGYPVTAKDCRGKTVTIRSAPKRIISLTPSNTEILFALGLGDRIVGDTTWCDYPEAAKGKPKVGDQVTNIERVISMRPDLVVAHGKINDSAIKAIERHGITVFALDPKTLRQLVGDIQTLGRITGTEPAARRASGRITAAEALVHKKLAGVKGRPKALVSVQADPLWAAGPQTFVDEIIRMTGAVNIAGDAKPGFNQYSTEIATSKNPDVVIGTYQGDRRVFTSGQWKQTNAARSGRVYEIKPDIIVRAGPRLADGIIAIARMVHPDVFGKR